MATKASSDGIKASKSPGTQIDSILNAMTRRQETVARKTATNAAVPNLEIMSANMLERGTWKPKKELTDSLKVNSNRLPKPETRLANVEVNSDDVDEGGFCLLKPSRAGVSSRNAQGISLCKSCGLYVDIKERLELLNDIFHRSCFRCTVCGVGLSSVEATLHRNSWRCFNHAKDAGNEDDACIINEDDIGMSKREVDEKKAKRDSKSEIMKEATEITKTSQNVADAASVAGNTRRMSDIREKFARGESTDQKEVKHRKVKVKYAGVDSVKNKFMEEANKPAAVQRPTDEKGARKMKEITPLREGVASGILESEPAPRQEGVIGMEEYQPTVDYIKIGKTTKNMREKFQNLEKTGGIDVNGTDQDKEPDEYHQVASEATRNAKARWKDIESGKVETKVNKTKIDMGSSETASDHTSEPDKLLGIARADDNRDSAHDIVTTSAAERKEAFLKKAAQETAFKRVDPAAELKELAKREKNSVYENTPAAQSEDVVSTANRVDDFSNLSTAKSLREKFSDPSQLQKEVKKTQIDIRGEGGVYENEPARRDDVIHYNDESSGQLDQSSAKWASNAKERFIKDAEERSKVVKSQQITMLGEGGVYENKPEVRDDVIRYDDESSDGLDQSSAKWASAAKERFMKDAEERSMTIRSQPVMLIDGVSGPTVFESQPISSAADARADNQDDEQLSGQFATIAKQRFLESQRKAQEATNQKARPEIIDIWSNLPKESGVYENTPSERPEGIIVSGAYSDDDEEEDDEE